MLASPVHALSSGELSRMQIKQIVRLGCLLATLLPGIGAQILPEGSRITIRTIESVEADVSQVGATYRATVIAPVTVNGQVLIPVGSDALLQVVTTSPGELAGSSNEIDLKLASITVGKRTFNINTDVEKLIPSPSRPVDSARGVEHSGEAVKLKGLSITLPANATLAFSLDHNVSF